MTISVFGKDVSSAFKFALEMRGKLGVRLEREGGSWQVRLIAN